MVIMIMSDNAVTQQCYSFISGAADELAVLCLPRD